MKNAALDCITRMSLITRMITTPEVHRGVCLEEDERPDNELRNDKLMKAIAALLGFVLLAPAHAEDDVAPAMKAAIEKGLKRIEQGVSNYPKHRQCFSCHHQAMAVFSLTAASSAASPVDDALLKQQVEFSLRTFRNKTAIAKGQGVGGDSTGVVYALHTFAAAGRPYDETTAALVEYLLVKQAEGRLLADCGLRRPAADDGQPVHQRRPGHVRPEVHGPPKDARALLHCRSASTPPS